MKPQAPSPHLVEVRHDHCRVRPHPHVEVAPSVCVRKTDDALRRRKELFPRDVEVRLVRGEQAVHSRCRGPQRCRSVCDRRAPTEVGRIGLDGHGWWRRGQKGCPVPPLHPPCPPPKVVAEHGRNAHAARPAAETAKRRRHRLRHRVHMQATQPQALRREVGATLLCRRGADPPGEADPAVALHRSHPSIPDPAAPAGRSVCGPSRPGSRVVWDKICISPSTNERLTFTVQRYGRVALLSEGLTRLEKRARRKPSGPGSGPGGSGENRRKGVPAWVSCPGNGQLAHHLVERGEGSG